MLGAQHPSTLRLGHQFGGLPQRAMGQLKDAEVLYRRAVEARECTLGAEHPSTLRSVNCLADLPQLDRGQLKDAEVLYMRALEAQ